MRILIIEDEKPAATRLNKLLQAHFPTAELIGNLDTVSRSIRWFSENPAPDLIFCDIQLADGISFEIFEQVKVKVPIVFTTAFDHYAIRAFQVNAIDYLLKPIDPKDLARAVEKFRSRSIQPNLDLNLLKTLIQPQAKSFKTRFLVRFGEKIQSIPIEEIAIFFSEERVTFLQTHAGKKICPRFHTRAGRSPSRSGHFLPSQQKIPQSCGRHRGSADLLQQPIESQAD